MIGKVVVVAGLLGMWALFKGKAKPVLDALTSQSGFSTALDNSLGNMSLTPNPSSPTSSGNHAASGATGSNTNVDSGSHSALVNGIVTTIDKTYAQMTDSEKGAANDFAHRMG